MTGRENISQNDLSSEETADESKDVDVGRSGELSLWGRIYCRERKKDKFFKKN